MSARPAYLEREAARFWPKVDVGHPLGCWVWTAYATPPIPPYTGSYGEFARDHATFKGKKASAHRWSYEYCVGPIPEGLQLDHLCRNTLCVNPDHLEPVTHLENQRRGITWRARPYCPQGHRMAGDNVGLRVRSETGRPRRYCRECRRRTRAEWRARSGRR